MLKRRRRRRSELLVALEAHYLPEAKAACAPISLESLFAEYEPVAVQALFSEQAILRRESLRFSAAVLAPTRAMWRVVTRCLGARLPRTAYLLLFGHAQRVVLSLAGGGWAPQAGGLTLAHAPEALFGEGGELSAAASAALMRDWEEDSEGSEGGSAPGAALDFAHFALAWFQVADTWTEDVSAASYGGLLTRLFEALTRKNSAFAAADGIAAAARRRIEQPPRQAAGLGAPPPAAPPPSRRPVGEEAALELSFGRELGFIYQHVIRYVSPASEQAEAEERRRRLRRASRIDMSAAATAAAIAAAARLILLPLPPPAPPPPPALASAAAGRRAAAARPPHYPPLRRRSGRRKIGRAHV